ncbi:MAG: hypothetical protein GY940_12780, partial [bacterium]|nr:hypothetical protein [bacterium]
MNLKNIYSSLLLIVLCAAPFTLSAQYFDYHRDESPSISWNGVPLFDARMLGAGGVSLMASPAFSASINPALIPSTKETALGASYEIMQHEAFQYRGLNQGVFYSPDNQSQRNDRPSGFAIVFPYKGLRFSAGWSTINLLELPSFSFQADRYSYTGNFPGNENTVFAA